MNVKTQSVTSMFFSQILNFNAHTYNITPQNCENFYFEYFDVAKMASLTCMSIVEYIFELINAHAHSMVFHSRIKFEGHRNV